MSSDDRVTIELSTVAGQTLQAWQALQREIGKTTGELAAAKRASHGHGEGAHEAEGAWHHLTEAAKEFGAEAGTTAAESVLGFSSMAGALEKIVDVTRQAIEAQMDLNRERSKAHVGEEFAETKFLVQSMSQKGEGGKPLTPEEGKELAEEVKAIGAKGGVMPEDALAIGTEAVSQGVSAQNLPGFLEAAHAWANSQGKALDREMTNAFVAMVRGQDKNLGVGAAQNVFKKYFGAFLESLIQAPDLTAFSKANAGMGAVGIPLEDQLALDIKAKELYAGNADEAGTFVRALTTKLRAPGKGAEAKAAVSSLASMGLDLKDIDLQGEDLEEVFKRLKEGMDTLAPEKRLKALVPLVGQEYAAQLERLLNEREDIAGNRAKVFAGSPKADEAVARMRGTEKSRIDRLKAEQEKAEAEHGVPELELARAAMETVLAEHGANAAQIWLARTQFASSEAGEAIGAHQESPFQIAFHALRASLVTFGSADRAELDEELREKMAAEKPEKAPAAEEGEEAPPPRKPQSELVGADPEAAAELVQRQKDAKKLAADAKRKAEGDQKAQEKVADFDAKEARHAAKDAQMDAAKLKDEQATESARKKDHERKEAMADAAFSAAHPAKTTHGKHGKHGYRPGEHAPAPHRKHIPFAPATKAVKSAEEEVAQRLHEDDVARERAELTGEAAQKHAEAQAAAEKAGENTVQIEALRRKVPGVARELAREEAEEEPDEAAEEAPAAGRKPAAGKGRGAAGREPRNDVDGQREEKQNETAAAALRESREHNRLLREQIAVSRRGADASREAMRSLSRPAIG